jgi:hypothetical protein
MTGVATSRRRSSHSTTESAGKLLFPLEAPFYGQAVSKPVIGSLSQMVLPVILSHYLYFDRVLGVALDDRDSFSVNKGTRTSQGRGRSMELPMVMQLASEGAAHRAERLLYLWSIRVRYFESARPGQAFVFRLPIANSY